MNNLPFCVDLDDTLLKTDMLFESVLVLLKKNFFYIFLLPLWLISGRANLKRQIALRCEIDIVSLPYNNEFLEYLQNIHQKNTELILTTGSDIKFAQKIANHLKIFSEVIASDGKKNISGKGKRDYLLNKFGDKKFDYAGNSATDLCVWKHANQAIITNASPSVIAKAKRLNDNCQILNAKSFSLKSWIQAIRVHQWVKNILLFVSLITAHKLSDSMCIYNSVKAFLAFSLCSSSVYIFNDLMDLHSDRSHPNKQHRPFANCSLPISSGMIAIPILLFAAIIISFTLPLKFLLLLFIYIILTAWYSVHLKQKVLIDVILLSSLYTLRILAGSLAIAVPTTAWLLAFSVFLFLSLALMKRYTELFSLKQNNEDIIKGRGYCSQDLEIIAAMGSASGYISVLVLALYIQNPRITILYNTSELLWFLCPLILYWISRMWVLAHRGKMIDDPIIFAIKDKISYTVGILSLFIIFLASTI